MNPAQASVRVAPPWKPGTPLEAPYAIPPEAAGPPQSPAAQSPVAVIVSHGMGQQVPFETLNLVADILRAAEMRRGAAAPVVVVRRVQLADRELTRAEIQLRGTDGKPRHVHLYESYWAPLTEGKVTVRDTIGFLFTAALAGLRRSPAGRFKRFLFNDWQSHVVSWRTPAALMGALLVTASLILMNSAIVAVTTLRVVSGATGPWSNSALLADLTAVFALFLLVSVILTLGGMGLPKLVRGGRRADGSHRRPGRVLLALSWTCVWLSVFAVILMLPLLIAAFVYQHSCEGQRLYDFALTNRLVGGINRESIPAGTKLLLVGVWGLAVRLSFIVRSFLLQYIGDVAAYVSAHTVNRFYETRRAIQDAAFRTVKDVYMATATADGPPLYSNVVMVGHSLGSVIAYDMLNAVIRHDALLDRPTGAARRTSMLLTFGSPLDKTAFVFRTQRGKGADVREASAAAVQSIITTPALRPARWVNIWNKADWISGSLEFYDPPSCAGDAIRVQNLIDAEATTPVMAHTEYWSNLLLADTLHKAVTGTPPHAAPGDQLAPA